MPTFLYVDTDTVVTVPTSSTVATSIRVEVVTNDGAFSPAGTATLDGAFLVPLLATEVPRAFERQVWTIRVHYLDAAGTTSTAERDFVLAVRGSEPDAGAAAIVESLKLQLPDVNEAVLLDIVSDVKQFVANWCRIVDVPETLHGAIKQLALIRYNRLGSEGLESESYSGSSFNFAQDIPPDVRRDMNAHRRVGF